jgi:hypothetical protein
VSEPIWLPTYVSVKSPRNNKPAKKGQPRIVGLESAQGDVGCRGWFQCPFLDGLRWGNIEVRASGLAAEILLTAGALLRLRPSWLTKIFRVEPRRAPDFIGLGIATSRLLGIFRNSGYGPVFR